MLARVSESADVRWYWTDRHGGCSKPPYAGFNLGDHVGDDAAAVTANRVALAEAVGVASDALALMTQVHGRAVAVVEGRRQAGAASPVADALVTRERGLALVVLVADCVPVLLTAADHDGHPVLAAVHAGRAGVELDVVGAAVAAMTGLGADPTTARAVVGPCICGPCYEVPDELADRIGAAAPGSRTISRAGTAALDLRAGVTAQLHAAGVATVVQENLCTRESAAFFSHRRNGVTGRFGGVVVARGEPS